MNERDISVLMKGVAPVIRDLVASVIDPLVKDNAELRRQIEELRAVDHAEAILACVRAEVAALPAAKNGVDGAPGRDGLDGQAGKDGIDGAPGLNGERGADGANGRDGVDGKSVDPVDVERMVTDAISRIPAPKDGRDGADGKDGAPGTDGKDGLPGTKGADGERGADGAPGQDGINGHDGADGKSIDPAAVAEMVAAEIEKANVEGIVQRVVEALPTPRDGVDGKDGEIGPKGEKGDAGAEGASGRDGIDGAVGRDGIDGKDGRDGADGKLPIVRAWIDTVHREGDVVSHSGATWQASRDTGKEPPHTDWTCLAASGRPGKDADEIQVRETYDADTTYRRLNIVALNGNAFIARKDEPGPCPGADWQVIAMRGKAGAPGEPGKKGDMGSRGLPGPGLSEMSFGPDGILKARNADGSEVECDMHAILSRLGS
jgi:hypothetical protein